MYTLCNKIMILYNKTVNFYYSNSYIYIFYYYKKIYI